MKPLIIGEGVVISDTASTVKRLTICCIRFGTISPRGHFDYARRETDSLLIQLNKREIITGQVQNYNSRHRCTGPRSVLR